MCSRARAPSELMGVIRSVCAGEVYVAPALAWSLLREMSSPRSSPLDELTAREREVLELVAEGLSNQEIGDRMSLAEKTIKHYMTNILGKLQVRSRVEAALLAYREGLGVPPEGREGSRSTLRRADAHANARADARVNARADAHANARANAQLRLTRGDPR